jgi:two-component system response regulator LytT
MKILAIDSETHSLPLLEQHCRTILANRLERFTTADSFATALDRLGETAFDLVLLEPQLPHNDGLVLLADHTVRAAQTIIVTAHTELALRAFEHGVLDFVPKPVNRERLAKALLRAAAPHHARTSGHGSEKFLAVRRLGRIDFVPIDELVYVEGSDKYSELVLANGQRSFYDKCLGRLEETLPHSFVRIHKSYLVRFPLVSRLLVQKGSRYFAELKNGVRLPVGRSRYAQIKSRLL